MVEIKAETDVLSDAWPSVAAAVLAGGEPVWCRRAMPTNGAGVLYVCTSQAPLLAGGRPR
jgi:hypothetical protein